MSSYISIFCSKLSHFLLDCKLQLIFFFVLFGLLQVSIQFLKEQFYLNIYYGDILLDFGLKGVKNHKIKVRFFFYPPPINLQLKISNTCHYAQFKKKQQKNKTGNRSKLKLLKFQSHKLSSLSAVKKTVTGVEQGGEDFFFVCTHKFPT